MYKKTKSDLVCLLLFSSIRIPIEERLVSYNNQYEEAKSISYPKSNHYYA